MSSYNISIEQEISFNENTKYIINQIEANLKNIDVLKKDFYFEMSKKKINKILIKYFYQEKTGKNISRIKKFIIF